MIRFFVGQKVRVVCIYRAENVHLIGAHGRIAEIVELKNAPPGDEITYGLDIFPIEWVRDSADIFLIQVSGFGPEQLEPILPDGHRASDYSLSELLDRCKQGEGVPV